MKKYAAALIAAVMLVSLAGCTGDKPSSQEKGQAITEDTFAKQSAAVPYPGKELTDSLERRNLRERLVRTNEPDAIGYVYLLNFGKVLGYYTIKGKVSSTQSQMTPSTSVERHGDTGGGNITYPAPGDDGSYSANEDGVFFFTTEGAFVETNLDYVFADQPLPFDVPELSK